MTRLPFSGHGTALDDWNGVEAVFDTRHPLGVLRCRTVQCHRTSLGQCSLAPQPYLPLELRRPILNMFLASPARLIQ